MPRRSQFSREEVYGNACVQRPVATRSVALRVGLWALGLAECFLGIRQGRP